MSDIPNVLAKRYASKSLANVWTEEYKIGLERWLWITVLKAQQKAGLHVPEGAINAYWNVIENVDLNSITERERVLRHDVKARIEEFNALAGFQCIHEGMTSRDITDNVEQAQIFESLGILRLHAAALLYRLGEKIRAFRNVRVCARTHNVPAQLTTLGRRFAMWAQEFIYAFHELELLVEHYPLRGIKGPVGTQQDILELLGDSDVLDDLEKEVCDKFNGGGTFDCVGQVYPRSLDFRVVTTLVQLASAPANFAITMRLMAGQQQVSEGFKKDQTGSSAMPHKMNSRTCERIGGLLAVLRGHMTMAAENIGNQWYEGDVSCSVPRRLIFPDAFFALDGIFEATMTVLDEMAVFEPVLERELKVELPYLATSRLLIAAVEAGMGREDAHAIIKRYSTEALKEARETGSVSHFVSSLIDDPNFPVDPDRIEECLALQPGNASRQIDSVLEVIERFTRAFPDVADYRPASIL